MSFLRIITAEDTSILIGPGTGRWSPKSRERDVSPLSRVSYHS